MVSDFILCYNATTLLTCVNNTFSVMHLADAFIQIDMHCIQDIDFISLCIPWESKPITLAPFAYLFSIYLIMMIYKTHDKHGKKVTYPSLKTRPKDLVEKNTFARENRFKQTTHENIHQKCRSSFTYENQCKMHQFHPR